MKRLAALLLCGALMLPLTTGAQGAQQQQAQEASGVSRGQAAQMFYNLLLEKNVSITDTLHRCSR